MRRFVYIPYSRKRQFVACYLRSLTGIMASRTRLPSNADFLLQYMEELSGSDDEFDGYLDPEEGPVAYRQEDETPLSRSQSLDDLAAESPLGGRSPSLSPMQGQYESGSPLRSSSPSLSSSRTRAVPAGPSPAPSLVSRV